MPRFTPGLAAVAGAFALAACVVPPPSGPSVMAMPAQGKTFQEFQQDDAFCQQYAAQLTGNASPGQAATDSAVGSAVVGTVLGAAAGAALGAASGNPAAGAAIGAGAGLVMGGAAGAANGQVSGAAVQQRYDMRYVQCMAGRGESVPMPAAGGGAPSAAYPAYGPYPYPYPYPGYYGPAVGGAVVIGGGYPRWGGWGGGYRWGGGYGYHHW